MQRTYEVRATKRARKQGEKLPISEEARVQIIKELKRLKFWNTNEEEYTYETAYGAIEFKFQERDHWIRVFVFQDDLRRTMWVFRVIAKKTNQIAQEDKMAIETAVSEFEREIRLLKAQEARNMKKGNLSAIDGGGTKK